MSDSIIIYKMFGLWIPMDRFWTSLVLLFFFMAFGLVLDTTDSKQVTDRQTNQEKCVPSSLKKHLLPNAKWFHYIPEIMIITVCTIASFQKRR